VRDHDLQIVLLRRDDADLLSLYLRLDLKAEGLNDLDELFGFVLRYSRCEIRHLLEAAAEDLLRILVRQEL
jgi:hypothetical protein